VLCFKFDCADLSAFGTMPYAVARTIFLRKFGGMTLRVSDKFGFIPYEFSSRVEYDVRWGRSDVYCSSVAR